MSEIIYKESQRQLPWIISVLIILMAAIVEAVLFYSYFYQDRNSVPWYLLAVVTVLMVSLVYLALFLRTTVTVTEDEVIIKTIPVRRILKKKIKNVEIQDIKALRQYGGWGIRYTGKKIGYISYGDKRGVMLHFEKGNDIMISSKDPEALMEAITS